jgi:hypothetical protein
MNHLRLFEEWNKKRFASKEEQRDYYRKPTASIEERTYTTEQLCANIKTYCCDNFEYFKNLIINNVDFT